MGRRYEVWRCEFEKFVRLQEKWCELLEAEAREEKESECKTEEDRPPTSRTSTSVAFGDVATFTPEKVAWLRGGKLWQKRKAAWWSKSWVV